MEKKTNTKKIDIHCACAIGDLSEMAELKPVKKPGAEIKIKALTKDELKKEKSNPKQ